MAGWIAEMGGWVGLGVWFSKGVLILFSLVSVGVMIERAISLSRVRKIELRDYNVLKKALLKRDMQTVNTAVAASSAPSAAVLEAGMELREAGDEIVREAMAQEVVVQTTALSKNLAILATVASTAPYVGLFGTVLGVLMAFERIATTGKSGASVVAAPIAEALTATAIGLGVAIPAVMAYNFFNGKVNALSLEVETHALDLAARLPQDYTATTTGGETLEAR